MPVKNVLLCRLELELEREKLEREIRERELRERSLLELDKHPELDLKPGPASKYSYIHLLFCKLSLIRN